MNRNVDQFKRAKALFAAIATVLGKALSPFQKQVELAQLDTYESRGKSGKKPRHASKHYVAHDKRAALKIRNKSR